MREFFLVALGGAIGSAVRYAFSLLTPLIFGRSYLLTGTLIVNILGCIAIGILIEWMEAKQLMASGLKLLVLVGFLGGFTTYSAFGLEVLEIYRESIGNALFYIGLHLFLGIGGIWLGIMGGQYLLKFS